MKSMREFRLHFTKKPAFTAREAELFLENRKSSPGYYKLVIHNLLSRREVYRITRGVYTFQEDAQMSGFGFSPFYYGLEDALSLRNVWEQETNPVVITPRKVRVGIRQFEGRNFVVRRIDRQMFFGYTYVAYGDFQIPVSTVEKAFIDFIYYRIELPRELMFAILSRSSRRTINEYLHEIPKWLSKKVQEKIEELQ
jgi:predicted transcriptional regulator of viral defense system